MVALVTAQSDDEVEAVLAGLEPGERDWLMRLAGGMIAVGAERDDKALQVALWLAAERTKR